MKRDTKTRKKTSQILKHLQEEGWMIEKMYQIAAEGKQAFDALSIELGKMVVESVMYLEREEIAGEDYSPKDHNIKKWASQRGSVYIGDQKKCVSIILD